MSQGALDHVPTASWTLCPRRTSGCRTRNICLRLSRALPLWVFDPVGGCPGQSVAPQAPLWRSHVRPGASSSSRGLHHTYGDFGSAGPGGVRRRPGESGKCRSRRPSHANGRPRGIMRARRALVRGGEFTGREHVRATLQIVSEKIQHVMEKSSIIGHFKKITYAQMNLPPVIRSNIFRVMTLPSRQPPGHPRDTLGIS